MRFDRRLAMILAASFLWALLVTAFFYRIAAHAGPRAAAPERPVVSAARALPVGASVTRDAVKLRSIPESLFPAGGFSRVEDVLDRPVIAAIQPDEPLVEARLAERGSGPGLGPMIPTGMRAIAVRVNDVVGVAGFVLPGMRVDVLVSGRPPNHADTVTRTVLQNIAVLSAGQTTQSDGKSQSINVPVVTLLVTPEDAEALTLANNEGHIQLVLRNSADSRVAATRGRELHELFGVKAAGDASGPASPAPARKRTSTAAPAAPPDPLAAVPLTAVPPPDRVVVMHGTHIQVVDPKSPESGAGK
jgi:pilus assembly protein CpaB